MNSRFIEFNNDGQFVRFVWQNEDEPRDGIGCTGLKFKCLNGKSPIELLEINEKRATFKILEDCKLYDGIYMNFQLKKDEIYRGFPDGKIEKIK